MSVFTTELLVRPYTVVSQDDIPSFVGWEVARPLVYNAGLGHEFSVPAGFITDFASTPRIVWWLIPLSWSHFVGQLGGFVKVYSNV